MMILVDHRSSLTGSTSSICLNFPKFFNSVELQSSTVYTTSDVCSTPCCDTGIGMSDGFALGFNKLSRWSCSAVVFSCQFPYRFLKIERLETRKWILAEKWMSHRFKRWKSSVNRSHRITVLKSPYTMLVTAYLVVDLTCSLSLLPPSPPPPK